MRSRHVLFVAIAAAALATSIAIPVVADDAVGMWVSRARLAHNGRSSHAPDRIVGMVHVPDGNLATVPGAMVSAYWTLRDGTRLHASAVTAFQGIASFEAWHGRGDYRLCVTNITKDGWSYDQELNRETCPELAVR